MHTESRVIISEHLAVPLCLIDHQVVLGFYQ